MNDKPNYWPQADVKRHRLLKPGNSLLFEPLVTLVSTLVFSMQTIGAMRFPGAGDFRKDPRALFVLSAHPKYGSADVGFAVAGLLSDFAADRWPTELPMFELPFNSGDALPPEKELGRATAQHRLWQAATRMTLLSFYEMNREQVAKTFGTEPRNWPAAWQVGRHVRNGMAHDGEWDIKPGTPTVCWRKYQLDEHTKGEILDGWMHTVEIVLLMEDMAGALPV